jgi:PAS domain S-box-containing protein
MDITHQKQIQKELRESEEKYRDLVERIHDVIYTVDTVGELTYISPAIEQMLGYSPSEVIGQPFSKFVTSEDLDKMRANFQRLSTGVEPGPNLYRLLTKRGEVRWVRTSSGPILDAGQVSGVRGVLTDITDQVRAEAQREQAAATAERARLARDLHDSVTQTLYSVALTAEALPRVWETHPDQAQEALGNMHRLARGALGEMRTLLFELQPAMLLDRDLEELMRQLAHATMGRTQIAVETRVHVGHPVPDEVRIAFYRIAQEALNNIEKHAAASQAIVELYSQPEQVMLHIEDDGNGFDPVTVPQLGFGVRNMADRAKDIGAEFHLESRPEQGTQINVVWQPENAGVDEV